VLVRSYSQLSSSYSPPTYSIPTLELDDSLLPGPPSSSSSLYCTSGASSSQLRTATAHTHNPKYDHQTPRFHHTTQLTHVSHRSAECWGAPCLQEWQTDRLDQQCLLCILERVWSQMREWVGCRWWKWQPSRPITSLSTWAVSTLPPVKAAKLRHTRRASRL
jgi:hypothetical protein